MDAEGRVDGAPAGPRAGAEPVTLVFDRRTHPDAADRARAWQAATSLSMETAFAPEDIEDFTASADVLPLGPFLLCDLSLGAGTVLRRRETRVRWEHDHIILDLVVAGRMEGRIGTRAVSIGAGDCPVFDLGCGMRLRVEDVRFIGLIMPRALVAAQVGVTLQGRRRRRPDKVGRRPD